MKQKSTQLAKCILLLFFICTGAVTISNAQPGNGLNFDGGIGGAGTGDYVIVGSASGFYTAGGSYTKEAWVFLAGPNNVGGAGYGVENILSSGDGIWVENGKIHAANNFDGNNYDIVDHADMTLNHWEHIALTYDAATTTMNLYRNGVLQETNTAAPASVSGQNYLGAFDDTGLGGGGLTAETYSWYGSLDQVRVYNVALTQAQIQANMTSTSSVLTGNLKGYYNFNTGTAGGTNTGLTSLTDNSGSGNGGTLTNFALTGATSNWVESYSMIVPVANSASHVSTGLTGFTARWTTPVATGTINNYIVDVSTTNDFTSPIAGSPFTVAFGTNSLAVTGLVAGDNYYYRVSADKTSVTGQGAFSNTISALATLPVNLLSFNVTKNGSSNQLQWSTASEINTKYFELLRSENGSDFVAIAKINSSGNSSTVKNYQYADNLAINVPPVYYYRLKITDINGNFTYSDIVLIKNNRSTVVTVYPNPAKDKVIVNITDNSLLNSKAVLSDVNGKVLQTVNITQTATPIFINTYARGVYLLKLANGESFKLVKE
ncbi:LamG-like jellyroll fold domain-containing protein [Ferruginibacter sp.]